MRGANLRAFKARTACNSLGMRVQRPATAERRRPSAPSAAGSTGNRTSSTDTRSPPTRARLLPADRVVTANHSDLLARNPRLLAIHQQYVNSLQLQSDRGAENADGNECSSARARLWHEALSSSMEVFCIQPTALPQAVAPEEDQDFMQADVYNVARFEWPRFRLRAVPAPPSIRSSLPVGEQLIHGSRALLRAADAFDQKHKQRASDAHNALRSHVGDVASKAKTKDFAVLLNALKYNQFADPRDELGTPVVVSPIRQRKTKVWTLEESEWKHRQTWADGKAFYDVDETVQKAFQSDWSRALRSHGLAHYILKHEDEGGDDDVGGADDDGDGFVDSEIVAVGLSLFRHHQLIFAAFDAYACLGAASKFSVTHMTQNAFKAFANESGLIDKSSKFCNASHIDQLYLLVISKQSDKKRGATKDGVDPLSEEMTGRLGSVQTEANESAQTGLSRCAFIQCLVRLAIMRYVLGGECGVASDAVDRVCLDHLGDAKFGTAWKLDHNLWRSMCCYTEVIDAVLVEHRQTLQSIVGYFADTDEGLKFEKEKKAVKLQEWLCLVRDLGLIDARFTIRDAVTVFVTSRLRVIDENKKASRLKLENLSVEDVFEALIKVSAMKALPTDKEIAEAGYLDAGEFLLRLRDTPSEEKRFTMERGVSLDVAFHMHTQGSPAPRQPIHRCFTHLVMLMIRTIELVAADKDDLKITKKEMRNFRARGGSIRGR